MAWVLKNEFATKDFVSVEKPARIEKYITLPTTGSVDENRTANYSVLQRAVYSILGRGASSWESRGEAFEKTAVEDVMACPTDNEYDFFRNIELHKMHVRTDSYNEKVGNENYHSIWCKKKRYVMPTTVGIRDAPTSSLILDGNRVVTTSVKEILKAGPEGVGIEDDKDLTWFVPVVELYLNKPPSVGNVDTRAVGVHPESVQSVILGAKMKMKVWRNPDNLLNYHEIKEGSARAPDQKDAAITYDETAQLFQIQQDVE